MYVELHRCLIDYNYVGKLDFTWSDKLAEQVWNLQSLMAGKQHVYQLSEEDFYIYHLLHFYKHFMYAGAGLRPVIDVYIFLQKQKNLNREYIQQQLEQMNLGAFAQKIEGFARACFDDTWQESDKVILDYLTNGGIYGDQATLKLARIASEGKATLQKSIISLQIARCFPVLRIMQKQYPVLYSYPWLLPVFWGVRAVRIALFKRQKINHFNDEVKTVLQHKQQSEYEYDRIKQVFQVLGIGKK